MAGVRNGLNSGSSWLVGDWLLKGFVEETGTDDTVVWCSGWLKVDNKGFNEGVYGWLVVGVKVV